MQALERCTAFLNLKDVSPELPAAKASVNPLDLCRVHLAAFLSETVACNIEDAFKSILWPNNISSGDLAVVLPKLRPGMKANEVAADLMRKVRI